MDRFDKQRYADVYALGHMDRFVSPQPDEMTWAPRMLHHVLHKPAVTMMQSSTQLSMCSLVMQSQSCLPGISMIVSARHVQQHAVA